MTNKKGGCRKVVYKNPDCMGHYDFDHIVQFAKMRFIDGHSTINLLMHAKNDIEREEIALVCMLDIDEDIVSNIELNCRYSWECQVKDCRHRLRNLIEARLKN